MKGSYDADKNGHKRKGHSPLFGPRADELQDASGLRETLQTRGPRAVKLNELFEAAFDAFVEKGKHK